MINLTIWLSSFPLGAIFFASPYLLTDTPKETLQAPIADFALLLAVVLLVPPLFERLKLPGLVGLLAAGVLLGGSGLSWLNPSSETMKLLSDIGKTYLMFVAGLEIDMALFQRTRNRSLSFGALTFAIPFACGVGVSLLLGFGPLAAVLVGSLLASHTLLAYPIVQRLGVVGDEAVTVTVGATIFTDVASLVVLAVCLGISKGNFTTAKLLFLLGSLSLYAIAVLFGLKQLARSFFRRNSQDEGNQFLFVMLSVFLAAVGAQLVGVEGIIGAFLAGLAINSVIGDGPVKEKTEFVGSVLFIPMFFVQMGLLLDLNALAELVSFIQLPLLIVGGLLLSKLLAALAAKQLFGYSWPQTWVMWSLSVPQVAATLAAALVGYEANIIDAQVFNSVVLLMLVTAIVGPLVTARTAGQLAVQAASVGSAPLDWLPPPTQEASPDEADSAYTVVVPVYNPRTERRLLLLGSLIAQYERGQLVPVSVAIAQPQMDSPRVERAVEDSRQRLSVATTLSKEAQVPIRPVLRIEYNVPQAICHVSKEQSANLILLGMGEQARMATLSDFRSSIYQGVLWGAHCPVVMARLLTDPVKFKRILLPVFNLSPRTLGVLRLAQVIATANQGNVTVVYSGSPSARLRWRSQLKLLVDKLPQTSTAIDVQILTSRDTATAITQMAADYDLVVMRSLRRRTGSGLNLITNLPDFESLLSQIEGSVIVVGEPA